MLGFLKSRPEERQADPGGPVLAPEGVKRTLHRSLFRTAAVAFWGLSSITLISDYIGPDLHVNYPVVWALVGLAYIGGVLSWSLPWERMPIRRFSAIILGGVSLITVGLFATGGVRTHLLPLYIVPVILGAVLLDVQMAAAITVICSLAAALPLASGWNGLYGRTWLLLVAASGLTTYISVRVRAALDEESATRRSQLEYQALHDSLTGLPNRILFTDRVEQALRMSRRSKTNCAVLLLDLDGFKEINDTLGHHYGDLLLQQVGNGLRAILRDSDTIARLGGDEFAILLPSLSDSSGASQTAMRLLASLEEPFSVAELALNVTASIGIAVYPENGEEADKLAQRADVAMYSAKASRSGYETYMSNNDPYAPARLRLISDLRQAINERKGLLLHYQPAVNLQTRRAIGVEALARWQHPESGLLSPDRFIPLAEHTGLIKPLTLLLLEEALSQCRTWQRAGHELTLAFNISARTLLDLRFPDEVSQLLEKWGIESKWLELEITESTIMVDPPRAQTILHKLDLMGVKLALDDFGTGYSSLISIRGLPLDDIKIDKSFVLNMPEDKNDAAIVRSVLDLGRNLGLRVVAEGAENANIVHQLVALGCEVAQGFYLSHPLPADTLTSWLRDQEKARQIPAA